MNSNKTKKPPKLKRPISSLTLVKYGLGVLFFVWLFYPTSGDSISEITDNRVQTYRFMMHRNHIDLRLGLPSLLHASVIEFDKKNNTSILYDIDSNWSIVRSEDGHVIISPQRSMYCRISNLPAQTLTEKGKVALKTEDFSGQESLIEQSIKHGIRQIISTRTFRISQENITPDQNVGIIYARTFALYRGEGLYEYSYHRIQVQEGGVFHHYCVSPFFNKAEKLVKILLSVEVTKSSVNILK